MQTNGGRFLWIQQAGQLPKEAYEERCKAYRYSISFCAGAVVFLTLAKGDLDADYPHDLLLLVLTMWGTAIFSGFAVLNLSLREVWYYQRLPNTSYMKRYRIDRLELLVLVIMIPIHWISVLTGVTAMAWLLLKSM